MTALRLDKLALTNYRCFARCELEFHPELTVLVAENGSGKTAVLDAAATALSVFVNAIYPAEKIRRIERSDVRLAPGPQRTMTPCLPTAYEAHAVVEDLAVAWESVVKTYGDKVRPSARGLAPLIDAAHRLRSDVTVLPLIAYYGTGRLWNGHRLTEHRRSSVTNVDERAAAYTDCLSSSSSLKGISAWFEHRFRQTASPAFKESLPANLAMIAGVTAATDNALLPAGWSHLHWDESLHALAAEHEQQGLLPLLELSDGVRTMLALVADVARRCAGLNPQLREGAPAETPGVLLIDEVDMHLHPRWQQQVLDLIRKAFPALQIIVSTHSPHVLSTVEKSSIRVFRSDGEIARVETPLIQTRGVESAEVLSTVMEVDPVPDVEESELLRRYRALIEDGHGEEPEALDLRSRLIAHFGDRHTVMLECDRLVRFQNFRLKKTRPEGA